MNEKDEDLVRVDLPEKMVKELQAFAAERGISFDELVVALLEKSFNTEQ